MIDIAIILGSTRPNRLGEEVAAWTHRVASRRSDARFEVVDLKKWNLPLFDEPVHWRVTAPHLDSTGSASSLRSEAVSAAVLRAMRQAYDRSTSYC